MVLCHARYSTNTVSTFERAQPFALLGHNGEINTINRFRQEARQVGVQLPRDGSDSQDVDRALEHFCIINNFNLMEAMEMVFPPSPFEIDQLTSPLSDIYTRMTLAYGAFAQGPAAIAARYGDTAVCSLDTLGLRPLWFSETEKEYIFSSERGAIQLEDMVNDFAPPGSGRENGFDNPSWSRCGSALPSQDPPAGHEHQSAACFIFSSAFIQFSRKSESTIWAANSIAVSSAEFPAVKYRQCCPKHEQCSCFIFPKFDHFRKVQLFLSTLQNLFWRQPDGAGNR